jgi:molecular chaperone DnaK (HSP70)
MGTNSVLIIGVDFGVIETRVAYANESQFDRYVNEVEQCIRNSFVMPGQKEKSFRKCIPSVLYYDTSPPSWGGPRLLDDRQPRVAYFLAGLEANSRDAYRRHVVQNHKVWGPPKTSPSVEGFLTSNDWTHPLLPGKNAVDYAADFLSGLIQHLLREIGMQPETLKFVVTVPPIWSQRARELTMEAVERAVQIPHEHITLLTELEAEALGCAKAGNVDLEENDTFLLCNTGGGTLVGRSLGCF